MITWTLEPNGVDAVVADLADGANPSRDSFSLLAWRLRTHRRRAPPTSDCGDPFGVEDAIWTLMPAYAALTVGAHQADDHHDRPAQADSRWASAHFAICLERSAQRVTSSKRRPVDRPVRTLRSNGPSP